MRPLRVPDLTFPEVLDHAFFGNKLAFENLFGDFPLAAALRRPRRPTWKKTPTVWPYDPGQGTSPLAAGAAGTAAAARTVSSPETAS